MDAPGTSRKASSLPRTLDDAELAATLAQLVGYSVILLVPAGFPDAMRVILRRFRDNRPLIVAEIPCRQRARREALMEAGWSAAPPNLGGYCTRLLGDPTRGDPGAIGEALRDAYRIVYGSRLQARRWQLVPYVESLGERVNQAIGDWPEVVILLLLFGGGVLALIYLLMFLTAAIGWRW